MATERIQKVLAHAGVASRRVIEEMILQGRVTVNGELVKDLPCFIDPRKDDVCVDGRRVRRQESPKVYYLLNKPQKVVCTQRDPQNRPRAVDLIPDIPQRVYCVGRLDADSTGVIILTNDGDLTEFVTHPRYGVEKTYVVEIQGRLDERKVQKLKDGVYLDGRPGSGAKLRVLRSNNKRSLLEITLREGRNREIRRTLARLGHKVRRLKRTAIGPVTDRGLKIGSYRRLSRSEVEKLRRSGRQSVKQQESRGKSKSRKQGDKND
ncbi:MAG: pseudouridine synthase [Phycisphaerae bacterium]